MYPHCGSSPLDSYLFAKCHTVGANSLTKPLTEGLSDGLQTLHYILSWVHSAILFAGQYGCQTVMTSHNFICHREFKTTLKYVARLVEGWSPLEVRSPLSCSMEVIAALVTFFLKIRVIPFSGYKYLLEMTCLHHEYASG